MVHQKEKLTIFTILLFISIKQNQILRDYNSDRKVTRMTIITISLTIPLIILIIMMCF